MTTEIPTSILNCISDALVRGWKIEAIQIYRTATKANLVDAKQEVERIDSELRAAEPERFLLTGSSRVWSLIRVSLWCLVTVISFGLALETVLSISQRQIIVGFRQIAYLVWPLAAVYATTSVIKEHRRRTSLAAKAPSK